MLERGGQGPAPPGEFAGDCGIGLDWHFVPFIEVFPLAVEPVVSFQGADPGCRCDEIELADQPFPGPGVGASVLPGGLDEELAEVFPALVIGPWCRDGPEDSSLRTSPR